MSTFFSDEMLSDDVWAVFGIFFWQIIAVGGNSFSENPNVCETFEVLDLAKVKNGWKLFSTGIKMGLV